jgi:DNA-binding transcriptional ArsR family regulator
MPTFHEYASAWLQAKTDGGIGDRPIDAHTTADCHWRLAKHLLPFFARYPLDEIDSALCQQFKAAKLREAAAIRDALKAGAVLRDQRRRRVRPLGPASIRKLIDCLASILDEAVEDGHIDRNPARGRRMRLRVPKPARSFLEMDELVALTHTAAEQDTELIGPLPSKPQPETTAGNVAEGLKAGMRPAEIAASLGLAKSTVSYHVRRLGIVGAARVCRSPRRRRNARGCRACGRASSATCGCATFACMTRAARACAFPTPRRKQGSARSS